jgi:hypothetical protein
MKTQWSKREIRSARQTSLAVVIEGLGYRLQPTGQGNCIVLDLPGEVVVKQHYWVRLEDGAAGNSIDFFVRLQGKSFTEAMGLLLEKSSLPTAS